MNGLAWSIVAAAAAGSVSLPAAARHLSAEPTVPPIVSHDYQPRRTQWGDPDFRGTWPIEHVSDAGIPLERPKEDGDRVWLTPDEFAERLTRAKKSDAGYQNDLGARGTVGLARWLQATPFGRRSSLLIDPPDGRLPPLTPQGEALWKAGRNSYNEGQAIDWVSDLDSYDRCVSYGLPLAMLPHPANDGIRVFQVPGYVAIQLEAFDTRIVPIGRPGHWPAAVRTWMGDSRGHWEGSTLVIETGNMVAGDSATSDMARRSASPVTGRSHGTIPMSAAAKVVERLTMTGPDTIDYRVTYSDPAVFAAPWTVEFEWTRDESYRMYEFACHEGNEVRELISSSRAQRRKDAAAAIAAGK
jgi:hypothetical protein